MHSERQSERYAERGETAVGGLYRSSWRGETPVRDVVMMTFDDPGNYRASLNVKRGAVRLGDILKIYSLNGRVVLLRVDEAPVFAPGIVDYFAPDDEAETVGAKVLCATPPARRRR